MIRVYERFALQDRKESPEVKKKRIIARKNRINDIARSRSISRALYIASSLLLCSCFIPSLSFANDPNYNTGGLGGMIVFLCLLAPVAYAYRVIARNDWNVFTDEEKNDDNDDLGAAPC